MYQSTEGLEAAGHLILTGLCAIPVIGGLASLIERIIVFIFGNPEESPLSKITFDIDKSRLQQLTHLDLFKNEPLLSSIRKSGNILEALDLHCDTLPSRQVVEGTINKAKLAKQQRIERNLNKFNSISSNRTVQMLEDNITGLLSIKPNDVFSDCPSASSLDALDCGFTDPIQAKYRITQARNERNSGLLRLPREIFLNALMPYLDKIKSFKLTCKSLHFIYKNYCKEEILKIIQYARSLENCILSNKSIESLFGANKFLKEPGGSYIPFKFDVDKWTEIAQNTTKIISRKECELELIEALSEYRLIKRKNDSTDHLTIIIDSLKKYDVSSSLDEICNKALRTTVGRIKIIKILLPFMEAIADVNHQLIHLKGKELKFAPWFQVQFWNSEDSSWIQPGKGQGYDKVKYLQKYPQAHIRAHHFVKLRTGDRLMLSPTNLDASCSPVILRCMDEDMHFEKRINNDLKLHIVYIRTYGDRYGYTSQDKYGERLKVAQKLLRISNRIQDNTPIFIS